MAELLIVNPPMVPEVAVTEPLTESPSLVTDITVLLEAERVNPLLVKLHPKVEELPPDESTFDETVADREVAVCSSVEISPSALVRRVERLDTVCVMVEMLPSAVDTLVVMPLTEVVREEILPV